MYSTNNDEINPEELTKQIIDVLQQQVNSSKPEFKKALFEKMCENLEKESECFNVKVEENGEKWDLTYELPVINVLRATAKVWRFPQRTKKEKFSILFRWYVIRGIKKIFTNKYKR